MGKFTVDRGAARNGGDKWDRARGRCHLMQIVFINVKWGKLHAYMCNRHLYKWGKLHAWTCNKHLN